MIQALVKQTLLDVFQNLLKYEIIEPRFKFSMDGHHYIPEKNIQLKDIRSPKVICFYETINRSIKQLVLLFRVLRNYLIKKKNKWLINYHNHPIIFCGDYYYFLLKKLKEKMGQKIGFKITP